MTTQWVPVNELDYVLAIERIVSAGKPPVDVSLCRLVEVDAPHPDWSQAPEWAQWWTVDADGRVRWSESVPVLDHSGFWDVYYEDRPHNRQAIGKTIDIPLGIDWRTLKVQRPQVTP